MILLESANKVIHDLLLERFNAESPVIVDFKCADYDGAMWHVTIPDDNKQLVKVSLTCGAAQSCLKHGGQDRLKTVYGSNFISAAAGYDVSIEYNIDKIGNKEQVATAAAMLKTELCAAPLIKICDSAESGGNLSGVVDIPLRSTEERMWIKQDGKDRVTILFSITFTDADDIVIGKVFLQEFKKSVAGAPNVDFVYKNPPLELKDVKDLPRSPNVCYLTFVLFDRHFKGEKKIKAAQSLISFRNYLHYHIKCAKSHLHTRMRNRVEALLKILNRAKQETEEDKEKKTASGRTFTRKE